MGELRSTFSEGESGSTDDGLASELGSMAEQNRLKGTLAKTPEQDELPPQTMLMIFGKSQGVTYYPSPTNPERIVVEFVREDGGKGKTNFAKEDFEKRQEQAK